MDESRDAELTKGRGRKPPPGKPYDWGLVEVPTMAKYRTDRKLWLTADRSRVVEDGDPEAAFLLASANKELDEATADRYGLAPKKASGKQVAGPPADKALKAPAAKGKE